MKTDDTSQPKSGIDAISTRQLTSRLRGRGNATLRRVAMVVFALCHFVWLPNAHSDYRFEYLGKALEVEGMHIWGASPVIGPDGRVHLFVAQWPINTQNNFSGWYKDCEIAHYVGDDPAGPFEFVRVAVSDRDGRFNSPHNPTVKHIDGKYVLCFIVNEDNKLKTQRIVMLIADSLDDDWRPAAGAESDGTMLRKSDVPSDWNYTARLGVSNPTLLKFQGKYLLYNKSVVNKNVSARGGSYTYGVAVSDTLEGPYIHHPESVTPLWFGIEDAYAVEFDNAVHLLTRDFGGKKGSHGGGLWWSSKDGFRFEKNKVRRSFEHLTHYIGKEKLQNAAVHRGDLSGRLERPQLLSIDNQPAYLYVATGTNENRRCGSCSHVFRVIDEE
ncbi:glycoside hydrolase family protein [Rhodopirellula sallentina]|uniref:glycoside hydrolase family protein n=1 Tax=Rhodopirellula sallentina TaxID=1263869 RepID=UPI001181C1FD|nr:glycoside hydrolase family protein [Rhodopirellula sallentina]